MVPLSAFSHPVSNLKKGLTIFPEYFFLKAHRYYANSAEEFREEKKKVNVRELVKLADRLDETQNFYKINEYY
jgi:hypothetical protein